MAQATLYSPNGKKVVVTVGSQQAKDYQRLGYALDPYPAGQKFATLYGPNDERHVVAVGSSEGARLSGLGYGLKPGSYKAPVSTGGGAAGAGGAAGGGAGSGGSTAPSYDSVDFTIPGTSTVVKIPTSLANDPIFKQLDPTNQGIAAYQWSIVASQNDQKAKAFSDALDVAAKQSNAYYGEIFNIAKDSLQRTLGTNDADLNSMETSLMSRRDAIKSALATDTGYLSTEQQASLAKQADEYDQQITSIRNNMAATGLTSSTIAARADELAKKANEGVVGGITRATQYQLNKANQSAQSNLADIDLQQKDAERKTLEAKTSAIRSAEAQFGTAALRGLGYDSLLLGGSKDSTGNTIADLSGSITGAKASDVLSRINALMGAGHTVTP